MPDLFLFVFKLQVPKILQIIENCCLGLPTKAVFFSMAEFNVGSDNREFWLTATLMPRLPLLFLSSRTKRSAVFKLMIDGDLEHTS